MKALCSIFVKWAPPLEKSRLIGFACSGSYIGNVIALPLGNVINSCAALIILFNYF